MKRKIERFLLGGILAPLAPIAGFLLFWWASYTFLPENWIPVCAISGIVLGIMVDVLILKRLLQHVDRLGVVFWLAVLLFYSVGVFGLFMGVPIFNAVLAVPAGFVVGVRLAHRLADRSQIQHTCRQTCVLTTTLMALVCSASAFFAMASPSTPSDLRGMLGLSFEVTPPMIWGLILVGGAGLLAVNWVLTGLSVRLTHRFFGRA